jgi:hypothetical protein
MREITYAMVTMCSKKRLTVMARQILQKRESGVIPEKDGRVKKSIILFQSKESKGLKKIDGSHGYFQDPNLIFRPPCCFLKLDDDPALPLPHNSIISLSQSEPHHELTQRSFWILETCVECRWTENNKRQMKTLIGFGFLAELFHGCTQHTISHRGREVIRLLSSRTKNLTVDIQQSLALPTECTLSTGVRGYLIRQVSRKIKSKEYWDIQFFESVHEPFLLELQIKAFGNQQ